MEHDFRFKVKVGLNLSDDIRRLKMVRDCIGPEKKLMVDANQCWGVQTAIDWMKQLAQYNILWIEEPTSPDDILGHGYVSRCLAPDGIGVATGECCQNCVMFKQFLQSGAMQFCQIDSCRLAGPNEIMAVILMAAKYKVPVCPHAGGVGLCELVQHLSIWDYVSVSKSKENRMTEFVNHLHEHFVDPVVVKGGCYLAPQMPGYSIQMKESSVQDYEYPNGRMWKELLTSGRYTGTMKQTT
ncbi:hypothetical protein LSH36_1496g00005 [Paralvinella palmiformis]|uniref:Mandelate racemase/muconate lactonizing enzyme C-terminal domain-containing protein n=1 Tax=Paralvinella palmiformis TaxID=53620 RepID=A0AAD9MNS7_9ANNE|nr:hypothetical protein LSH36_1496g00005 [Paralvinella palmiformis]